MKTVTLVLLVCLSLVSVAHADKVLMKADLNKDGKQESVIKTDYSYGSGGSFYFIYVKAGSKDLFYQGFCLGNGDFLVRDVNPRYPGKEIVVWYKSDEKPYRFEITWWGWDKTIGHYSMYSAVLSKKTTWQAALKEYEGKEEKIPFCQMIARARILLSSLKNKDISAVDRALGPGMEGTYEKYNDQMWPEPGSTAFQNQFFCKLIDWPQGKGNDWFCSVVFEGIEPRKGWDSGYSIQINYISESHHQYPRDWEPWTPGG
ncbi:MAG: hypothetical protein WCW17_01385 [Patescibacteria group bacterium]|jgi:hypothetical protein